MYWDSTEKKNKRIPKNQVPSDVDTFQKAEDFAKQWMARVDSVAHRIAKRLDYKKAYFEFEKLEESFSIYMQKKSPVDWSNSVSDLKYYVFNFFLNEKNCPNINDWHLHYFDFMEWLETKSVSIKGKRKISYSQMNSAISSLNNFIDYLIKRNKINPGAPKCRRFEQSKIKRRGIEDVLSSNEASDLLFELNIIDDEVADFVSIVMGIGARYSEALGLSLENIYQGEPDNQTLKNILMQYDLKCLGYLNFYTQLVNPSKPRDAMGVVQRKALKHRKKIDVADSRIVPVFKAQLWDLLVDKYNKCIQDYNQRRHGERFDNYLLFDGLSEGRINTALIAAYKKLAQYKRKTIHCLRHTYTTELSGLVSGDHRLFEIIVGHKDAKTTASYNHLHKSIALSISAKRTVALGGLKKVNPEKS